METMFCIKIFLIAILLLLYVAVAIDMETSLSYDVIWSYAGFLHRKVEKVLDIHDEVGTYKFIYSYWIQIYCMFLRMRCIFPRAEIGTLSIYVQM